MAQTVGEIMTTDVVTLLPGATVADAARAMRDANIGDVVLSHQNQLFGVLTDRDIVVRAIAEDRDINVTRAGEIATNNPTVVKAETSVEEALSIMKNKAVRRLPVLERGRVIGVVSIGDLIRDREPESPVAEIIAAPPNG